MTDAPTPLPPLPNPERYFGHSTALPMYSPEEMREYGAACAADLTACRAALRLAEAALKAGRVMWRSQKPAKLDEALSWRENDLKAEAMGDAALSAARAILQSDEEEGK